MTVDAYIESKPSPQREYCISLRAVLLKNIPAGLEERMNYGMPGYFVPHTVYPAGYHCAPAEPLPFLAFTAQKGSINLYHMGMYAKPALMDWFVGEYAKTAKHKIDIGKSCIRFKYYDEIPFELIGELVRRMDTKEWIRIYEESLKK